MWHYRPLDCSHSSLEQYSRQQQQNKQSLIASLSHTNNCNNERGQVH